MYFLLTNLSNEIRLSCEQRNGEYLCQFRGIELCFMSPNSRVNICAIKLFAKTNKSENNPFCLSLINYFRKILVKSINLLSITVSSFCSIIKQNNSKPFFLRRRHGKVEKEVFLGGGGKSF